MNDDPGDQDNRRFDSGSSEEWVDKIAESEGLSREDVLERLISSYWTLKEMFRLMEQTEEDLEARAGPDDVDMTDIGQPSTPEFEEFKTEVSEQIDTLRADLDALTSEVEGPDEEVNEQLNTLRADLDTLTSEVEGPDEEVKRLAAQLKGVDDRVTDIESRLSERQDSLQDRVDEEFGNLEVILDYLIETTDDIDTRTSTLSQDQRSIKRRWEERDRLADLKQRANRAGVREAACEYCDTAVDLAMLERPICPQCERTIEDVEPNKGWFGFGSNRLQVSNEPLQAEADEEEDPAGFDEEEAREAFDPDGFEFGGK